MPLVYAELRTLAAAKMANEREDHTLQPTALVHEAFLRLTGEFHTFAIDPSGNSLHLVDSTGLVRACSIKAATDIVDLTQLDLKEGVLQLQANKNGQLLIRSDSRRVGIVELLEP
ncbi:MAG: ECF-type sigma factor [Fuerstiella sp.]|nr:ECF-type sigma factor [Fuerstiella sp.]